MIHITCTNCHTTLEIDDAFAGGVCRCQHCGTIQTVPAHLKGNASAAPAPAPAPTPSGVRQQQQKPIYSTGRAGGGGTGRGGGTGLDELSDAVASSGLARSGLRKPGQGGLLDAGAVDYASPPEQRRKSPVLWLVIGGVVLLLLLAAGFFLLAGRSTVVPAPGPTVTKGTGGDEDIVVPKTANFCGVDLRAATGVVYVLDRGSASAELFDTLKATTYRSLESLGPDKQFAIVFWELGNEPVVAYPVKGLTAASPGNIRAADQAFEDVVAQGRSDPAGAVKDAATRGASDVIFVTAKGDDLDDEVIKQIDESFAGKRVHAFAIGEDFGESLKKIAKKHNGTYQLLRANQLRAFSR